MEEWKLISCHCFLHEELLQETLFSEANTRQYTFSKPTILVAVCIWNFKGIYKLFQLVETITFLQSSRCIFVGKKKKLMIILVSYQKRVCNSLHNIPFQIRKLKLLTIRRINLQFTDFPFKLQIFILEIIKFYFVRNVWIGEFSMG